RVCIRYVVRPDGGMLTRKMPEQLYRITRRASRIAASAFSATLAISTAAAQPRPANSIAQSPATAEQVTDTPEIKPAVDEFSTSVSGTIKNSDGLPMGDVTVFLVDRDTGEERST